MCPLNIADRPRNVPIRFSQEEMNFALTLAQRRQSPKDRAPQSVSDKRYRRHDGGTAHDNIETHRIGILGEMAAAKALGLDINLMVDLTGVHLPDLLYIGEKVEVKTLRGFLAFRRDEDFENGVAVLVTHVDGADFRVQGWTDVARFVAHRFYRDFGYGLRPCMRPVDLHAVESLIPCLVWGEPV